MRSHFLKALVLAPHPDDEVLGAGIWMTRHPARKICIVHLTDGSPRNLQDARAVNVSTREEYAAVRRAEFREARKLLAVPQSNCIRFSLVDQELWQDLPVLTRRLEHLTSLLKPDLVLCPAYEGGHPDHDSAAFAASVVSRGGSRFEVWEFPLYHAAEGAGMVVGKFLPEAVPSDEHLVQASEEDRRLKQLMVGCFKSQAGFLRQFPLDSERFRLMPDHDFTRAPHPGALLYERWGWEVTGQAWRERARQAIAVLT